MNKLLIFLLMIVIFSGCTKTEIIKPNSATTTLDSATVLHSVKLAAIAQNVKVSVKSNVITLLFAENADILLTPKGLDQSYAIHLLEDFSSSQLNKLDYTVTTKSGNTTFDWVDDNLNNIEEKMITDTTINGDAMKKIHVARNFKFIKNYADAKTAVAAEAAILKTNTDHVKFSSYVLFGKVYPTTTVTTPINYTE